MKPEYDKPWTLEGNGRGWPSFRTFFDADENGERFAKFATSAPALARALCLVEWAGTEEYEKVPGCPACHAGDFGHGHEAGCTLDAALTAAGLDAAAREAVRAALG